MADTARLGALARALRSRPQVSDEDVARAMEFRESVMHGHAEMDPQQAEADRLAGWRRAAGMTPTDVRGGTRGMLSSPTAQAKATEMALGLGPGATVYHGSPHKFDKFDMSKIGTGEGAQAYGHGLYFAENPGVARSYQYAGQPSYSGSLPKQYVDDALRKSGGDQKAALADLQGQFEALAGTTKYGEGKARQQIQDAINNFKTLASNEVGNLYKVDLPDEHIAKMLDWDKPLSQQPAAVQKGLGVPALATLEASRDRLLQELVAMEKAGTQMTPAGASIRGQLDQIANTINRWHVGDQSGQAVYQRLSLESGGMPKASGMLRDLGIPGIRYLDQGSRAVDATQAARITKMEQDIGHLRGQLAKPPQWAANQQGWADSIRKQLAEQESALAKVRRGANVTSNFVVFDADILKILGTEGEKMMAARERALKP